MSTLRPKLAHLLTLLGLGVAPPPPEPKAMQAIARAQRRPRELQVGEEVLVAPALKVRRTMVDGAPVDIALIYAGHREPDDEKLRALTDYARRMLLDWPVEICRLEVIVEDAGLDDIRRAQEKRARRAARGR